MFLLFLGAAFIVGPGLSLSSSASTNRLPIGRITTLDRSKLDTTADSRFYQEPKLVVHVDDEFRKELTELYSEYVSEDTVVLDLMSSHVSHLPRMPRRLDVHGMNMDELEQNPVRVETEGNAFVRNLNDQPNLVGPCNSEEYDLVLCCVGIQYLEEAEQVLADVARVLKPGGSIVISFSNRYFYEKALVGWIERGMQERTKLVRDYLRAAGGFEDVCVRGNGGSVWNQLLSVGGLSSDPFVAVTAKRIETL